MSQRMKMSHFHEEKMREVLKKIADERSVEGSYGIIDFNYAELLELTGESIRTKSYISTFLTILEEQGKVNRIRRGSSGFPSRWNVKNFIEAKPIELPDAVVSEVQVSVVKEPTPEAIEVVEAVKPAVDNTDTILAIKDAINEMSDYLRDLPDQMIAHLHALSNDLDLSNGEESEELKTQLEEVRSQVRALNKQLEESNSERSQLTFDLTLKSQELQERRVIEINKDAVVRYKHSIMDEMERFLAAEDWKRRNMKDHFRTTVSEKLDSIMTEVGVGES